ncbi:MAG: hypothetical protein EOO54_08240 [Haliea sp.]|nr:MAG: hypothetical protein EOO54_08240 [Haliea sp.]
MPEVKANGGPAERARVEAAIAEASTCVNEAERKLADAVQTLLIAVRGGLAQDAQRAMVASRMRKLNICLSDLSRALGLSVADELEPPDSMTR